MPPTLGVRGGGEGVRLEAAAARLGWRETETDWRRVLQRDDVDLVDVCTPGDTPAEIAIPPLEAGEHRPLGDIGAHIVDLTQHITGQRLTGVSALLETFVKERPLPASEGSLSGVAGQGTGTVTVDDAAVFLGRFDGGALASFEATRFALGRKNAIRIEVNGSRGSLAFDFEDMNVLHFFDGDEPATTAGFRRIVVTEPDHPYVGAWWPAGHGLGYEHGFTHQVVDLVEAIAKGDDPAPSFADGLQVQRVLDAVERSAADRSTWTEIPA